jgi:hypothetical protein
MQRTGIEDESKQITLEESSDSSNHSLLMTDTNSPEVLPGRMSTRVSKDYLRFLCGLFTE